MLRRFIALLPLLAATACSTPATRVDVGTVAPVSLGCFGTLGADGGCDPFGWRTCAPPFTPDVNGVCAPIVAESCAPGTMASLGETGCTKVGWVDCPAGFARDATSSGCLAVLPTSHCTGATREALGHTECVPIGDCTAPFPPPAATLFVDDSFTSTDATHFRTITAALAAAPDGATIAVDEGTYAEGIWPTRAVTIIGKCPEKVRLDGTGLGVPGVYARGVAGITVRGLTLIGHFQGVRVQGGVSLTVEDLVIERPRLAGLMAWEPGSNLTARRLAVREAKRSNGRAPGAEADEGSTMTLEDAVIAESQDFGAGATSPTSAQSALTMTRVVVRDSNPANEAGTGFGVVAVGGTVSLSQCAIVRNHVEGLRAVGAQSVLMATDVSVEGVSGIDSDYPAGLTFINGARGALTRVTASGNDDVNLTVEDLGTVVTATDCTFQRAAPDSTGNNGLGVAVLYGGSLSLTNCASVENAAAAFDVEAAARLELHHCLGSDTRRSSNGALGRGITVEDGATLVASDVSLERNVDDGLFVRGNDAATRSSATVARLLVRDTRPRASGESGVGVAIEGGAQLSLTDAALLRNSDVALVMNDRRSDAGLLSSAVVTNLVVQDTRPTGSGAHGAGVLIGADLVLENAALQRLSGQGLAVSGPGSALVARHITIDTVTPEPGWPSSFAFLGALGSLSTLDHVEVRRATLGLTFHGAGSAITSGYIGNNAVGVHVQGGSRLVEATPGAAAIPDVVVDSQTVFEGNTSRLGLDPVAIPSRFVPDAG